MAAKKIVVLVTTMYQTDLSKYREMNLHTDAVIANQTDRNEIFEETIDKYNVRLVSTDSRGLSRNRNIALAHFRQDEDIIVFADDDLIFVDGYDEMIAAEFDAHPYAEAIKFNLQDLSEIRKISMKRIERFEKATRRNMSASGVWGLAIRSETLKKMNLRFDERFGAGAEFYSGEDTIFLMNMIDQGISFYRSPLVIAGIDQTESSWFTGIDERYYRTSGAVIDAIYPLLSRFIVIRSAYRAYKRDNNAEMGFLGILRCYYKGIKDNREHSR